VGESGCITSSSGSLSANSALILSRSIAFSFLLESYNSSFIAKANADTKESQGFLE
jgi:hypothetical protein